MKWVNHSITAFCVTIALTGNPLLSMAAAAGSAVPDKVETFLPFTRHRGISHNPLFWAPLFFGITMWIYLPDETPHLLLLPGGVSKILVTGLMVGVSLHLLTDGLSKSGIPVFGKYRFAANLYKTFSLSEYLVTLGICIPCLAIGWFLGRLKPDINNIISYFQ